MIAGATDGPAGGATAATRDRRLKRERGVGEIMGRGRGLRHIHGDLKPMSVVVEDEDGTAANCQ